jgi:CBS domain-containing protein
MNVQEIMSPKVQTIAPDATLQQAAKMMLDAGCGILPVGNPDKLVGVLTDRDIVVRAVAQGKPPGDCKVREVMTAEIYCIAADDSLEEAERSMGEHRVRRLPVLDGARKLVGMVSLEDISLEHPSIAGHTLQDVSKPLVNRATGFAASD